MLGQVSLKFKASLGYNANGWPVWATQEEKKKKNSVDVHDSIFIKAMNKCGI
jgi:hypothetical protein